MGMDFKYHGSSNYPRFENELYSIAKIFGGEKSDYLKELESQKNVDSIEYFFGIISSDNSDLPKFVFPPETNKTLVKWFNDIYGYFTKEETKVIWNFISEHTEIKDMSRQIWNELKLLVSLNESWDIHR